MFGYSIEGLVNILHMRFLFLVPIGEQSKFVKLRQIRSIFHFFLSFSFSLLSSLKCLFMYRSKDFEETLEWVKFSSIAWTHDDKGFFYCQYEAPKDVLSYFFSHFLFPHLSAWRVISELQLKCFFSFCSFFVLLLCVLLFSCSKWQSTSLLSFHWYSSITRHSHLSKSKWTCTSVDPKISLTMTIS
jgi:hypothetical protein